MTSAYKKKLIEDKKWEYENMLADKLDEKTDVRTSGMEGFYKNLLTKNISMGSSVDGNAVSVYTAGSVRQVSLQENTEESSIAPKYEIFLPIIYFNKLSNTNIFKQYYLTKYTLRNCAITECL